MFRSGSPQALDSFVKCTTGPSHRSAEADGVRVYLREVLGALQHVSLVPMYRSHGRWLRSFLSLANQPAFVGVLAH